MSNNKLYFAQHGLAVDKIIDPQRPLSTSGIAQTQAIAKHLQHTGISVSQILHSGTYRAQQTAEIFASCLSQPPVQAVDYLSAMCDTALFTKNEAVNNTLYIGHLPHLGKLISLLLTGEETLNTICIQNSAIICLEQRNNQYQLLWYLSPELLVNKNPAF